MIRDFHQFLMEEKDIPDPGKAADFIWKKEVKKKTQGGIPNQPKQAKPLADENDDFLP